MTNKETIYIEDLAEGQIFSFKHVQPDFIYKVIGDLFEDSVSIVQLHKDKTPFKQSTYSYFGAEVIVHD